jgi:transcriptional regulator with XRE-family HTH domain
MGLKEKIDFLMKEKGLNQKEFADLIGVNYVVFNRSYSKNNFTGEITKSLIEKLPDVNYNWLFKDSEEFMFVVNEPQEVYGDSKLNRITKAMLILDELKKELSQ